MSADGIHARLVARFVGVAATLAGLVWIAGAAVSFFAPAHPDTLATLIGAAATIFAGYLAWESIFFKARLDDAEKVARARLRKEDLVVAITQSIHAAATLAARIVLELSQTGDRVGQSKRVKRQATMLSRVFNAESVIRLTDELAAEDRQVLLMIVNQLQSALAMAELGAEEPLSDDDLTIIRDVLTGLHRYIALFDEDLGAVYARDSRLPIGDKKSEAGNR